MFNFIFFRSRIAKEVNGDIVSTSSNAIPFLFKPYYTLTSGLKYSNRFFRGSKAKSKRESLNRLRNFLFNYFSRKFEFVNNNFGNKFLIHFNSKKKMSKRFVEILSYLYACNTDDDDNLIEFSKFNNKFINGFFYNRLHSMKTSTLSSNNSNRISFLDNIARLFQKKAYRYVSPLEKIRKKIDFFILHYQKFVPPRVSVKLLKNKKPFFFKLVKIFFPTVRLVNQTRVFRVYRKRRRRLSVLLAHFKKRFYIPKSFLKICLDNKRFFFVRLSMNYFSKGLRTINSAYNFFGSIKFSSDFSIFSTVGNFSSLNKEFFKKKISFNFFFLKILF